ncbi:MAG: DUF411 domain-containing protein [Acidimicrobiia bacterium]|nr:DUF411 domain-containing protein [Acidimicrobiia bacterium]MDH3397027.1 DUF411 domain-containing protein [Acidimicrobiia bacterium]MDH5615709.1 DUF411 domain-containing protein [Acidimicrobiia bacterium]
MDLTEDPQLAEFRAEHGVPEGALSCHTALVDGYVIEGHVPAGAILRLLAEHPDAVGLALPGMPADSPGMAGDPETWESQPVVLIRNDGEMVPFDF